MGDWVRAKWGTNTPPKDGPTGRPLDTKKVDIEISEVYTKSDILISLLDLESLLAKKIEDLKDLLEKI